MARLRARFADVYALVEGDAEAHGLPTVAADAGAAPSRRLDAIPRIDRRLGRRLVLTSGSTGDPVPHAKPWGLLVRNARPKRARLAERDRPRRPARRLARRDRAGAAHVRLRIERADRPARRRRVRRRRGRSIPADVAAALARAPAPRMLVTTPFHLKALLDVGVDAAAARRWCCARRRRSSPQLAARAERRLGAPLIEIYGCTEAGQVAIPANHRRSRMAALSTASALERRRRRPSRSAAATCRSRPCSPTCSKSSSAETLSPARPLQRPDQRRRQAQLDRPPRLPPQLDPRRRRRRVLDAARDDGEAAGSSAWSRSSSRPGIGAADHRRPARARRRRRSCRAASSTSTPCRAKRPASCAAARLAALAARHCAARARDEQAACDARGSSIAPIIRPSTATSPASRCCPASPCSPKCSRRRCDEPALAPCVGPRRASASSSSWRRCDPGAALVIVIAVAARALDWRVGEAAREVASGQFARADRAAGAAMKVDARTAPPTAGRASGSAAAAGSCALMRWIALASAGRRDARLLLHPIVCCFCSTARRGATRRATSAALSAGRRPGATSIAMSSRSPRPCSTASTSCRSASTVPVQASGIEAILEPFSRGEGVLAFGAHLGSFEALRMIGHDKGLRVAMIMYEDNARLINEALAAVAPQRRAAHHRARPRRGDALAPSLARRGRTRRAARRPHAARPFAALEGGRPALPRRAGAFLRRPVPPRRDAAAQGRLHGRAVSRRERYELRFIELADFADAPAGRPTSTARDAAIRAALGALRRDARGAVPRGAIQLVQLLRFLGRR